MSFKTDLLCPFVYEQINKIIDHGKIRKNHNKFALMMLYVNPFIRICFLMQLGQQVYCTDEVDAPINIKRQK